MAKCRPHQWNIEDWLPILGGTPKEHPSMKCRTCGRVHLDIGHTALDTA